MTHPVSVGENNGGSRGAAERGRPGGPAADRQKRACRAGAGVSRSPERGRNTGTMGVLRQASSLMPLARSNLCRLPERPILGTASGAIFPNRSASCTGWFFAWLRVTTAARNVTLRGVYEPLSSLQWSSLILERGNSASTTSCVAKGLRVPNGALLAARRRKRTQMAAQVGKKPLRTSRRSNHAPSATQASAIDDHKTIWRLLRKPAASASPLTGDNSRPASGTYCLYDFTGNP